MDLVSFEYEFEIRRRTRFVQVDYNDESGIWRVNNPSEDPFEAWAWKIVNDRGEDIDNLDLPEDSRNGDLTLASVYELLDDGRYQVVCEATEMPNGEPVIVESDFLPFKVDREAPELIWNQDAFAGDARVTTREDGIIQVALLRSSDNVDLAFGLFDKLQEARELQLVQIDSDGRGEHH